MADLKLIIEQLKKSIAENPQKPLDVNSYAFRVENEYNTLYEDYPDTLYENCSKTYDRMVNGKVSG